MTRPNFIHWFRGLFVRSRSLKSLGDGAIFPSHIFGRGTLYVAHKDGSYTQLQMTPGVISQIASALMNARRVGR